MLNRLQDRLTTLYGSPDTKNGKVLRWSPRLDFGVVVQRDTAKGKSQPYAWLPYPREGMPAPENAVLYPKGKKRHSATYTAAGIRKGRRHCDSKFRPTPTSTSLLISWPRCRPSVEPFKGR